MSEFIEKIGTTDFVQNLVTPNLGNYFYQYIQTLLKECTLDYFDLYGDLGTPTVALERSNALKLYTHECPEDNQNDYNGCSGWFPATLQEYKDIMDPIMN